MTDVFISYSKERRDEALKLASKLEELGYVPWWDTSLKPLGNYREEIDQNLDAARAVIVIWSPESIKSKWVQSEADHGEKQSKLINTMTMDLNNPGEQIPKPFNQTHAVLTDDILAIERALATLSVPHSHSNRANSAIDKEFEGAEYQKEQNLNLDDSINEAVKEQQKKDIEKRSVEHTAAVAEMLSFLSDENLTKLAVKHGGNIYI